MKKTITFVTLLLSTMAWAQDSGEIEICLHGGISLSNFTTSQDVFETNGRLGVNGGLGLDYYFSESLSLKLSAFYNQNGWVIDESVSSSSQITRTLTLHYLTVALAPNFHFGGNSNWYVTAGPYASFLLGANQGSSQVKRQYTSTDFGLTGGLGYKFPLSNDGNTKLFIELIHQLGLSNIVEENEGDAIKNSRSSLNLGISF